MGDLISRSAVLNFIKEEVKQDRPDDFKIRNIQRFIEDIPTAYNVDAVVAELEQQMNQYNRRARELVNTDIEAGIHNKGKACSYGHAIDIVKKGGVE